MKATNPGSTKQLNLPADPRNGSTNSEKKMGKLSEIGTGKKTLDQFAQALDDSRDYPTERFAHDAKKMLQDFIEISVTRGDYFVWDEAKALLRVLEILEARANG